MDWVSGWVGLGIGIGHWAVHCYYSIPVELRPLHLLLSPKWVLGLLLISLKQNYPFDMHWTPLSETDKQKRD